MGGLPPVIDSATVAAAAPDDDTTTVGTLGHLPVHHLQGGKKKIIAFPIFQPKLRFLISVFRIRIQSVDPAPGEER
jgi:hypothetical protein